MKPMAQIAWDTQEVERHLLDFFLRQGYLLLPSSSLVDELIPMSFVMSAGFPQIEAHIKEIHRQNVQNTVVVQNCFRHFDMKKIGESPIHLSLFRMAGAFHFGEISQSDQVQRVWRLLTDVYALPPERLWVTYFSGADISGRCFNEDAQTRLAWTKTGVSPSHIIGNLDGQNFWRQSRVGMDATMPAKCGRTTEVFFDRGEDLACGSNCRPGCACGRFVEIVNMLFIQWDCTEGDVHLLPVPFTEIVLGSERMAMIKQNAKDIFHIQTLFPLLSRIDQFCTVKDSNADKLIRVIADHLRALIFLLADGAPPPGKGGRAFIIRKLMREIFTAMKILEITLAEFLPSVVDLAIALHTPLYSSVGEVRSTLLQYLNAESAKFENTLQRGERRLDRLLSRSSFKVLSDKDMLAFEKSFGVPRLLLLRMLEERHLSLSSIDQENVL